MRKNLKYISVLLSAALAASAISSGGFAVSNSESGSISVRYAEANTTARLRSGVSAAYLEAAWESGEVTYTEKTADCTAVESSTEAVTWYDGWYVVSGEVNITEPVTVSGAVNLILADDCTLNANSGIVVETGNSLTIYTQENGTGTLIATGTTDDDNNASAGIGGSTVSADSGAITIHGGVISAVGGSTGSAGRSGAGIGGGSPNSGNGGSNGTVIIYGGTITANSGAGNLTGAGIGGGASSNNGNGGTGSNITIYGGSVTASSTGTDTGGAGIGGGSGVDNGGVVNNIQIYGGTINATGGNLGAGIGGGGSGSSADSSHKAGDGTVTISGGKVTAVGGQYAAGIGGGGGYYYRISYSGVSISGGCIGGTGSVTISGGIVNAGSPTDVYYSDYKGDPIGNGGNAGDTAATVTISEGYAVYQNGAPIEKGTEVTGAVTVKQCGHDEIEVRDNGDGTHGMSCPYCGYSYSHDTILTATADNNVITVREACDTCGYDEDLGTVTIHIPDMVYGDLTKEISAETTLTESVNVDGGYVNNPSGGTIIFSNFHTVDPPAMATLTGDAFLSVGTYRLKVHIIIVRDEMYVAECDLPFTIDKATLTADGAGTANGTYGTALSELGITGITAKLNDTEIAGKWEFVDTTLPDSGKSVRKAVFVPSSGADNFKELSADITLNISKAQGVLNLTDTTLNKKFGTDSKFSLESYCTTASDGVISYTTDSAAVTVSKSGEVTIISAGEAVITVSLAEGTNYTAAENKTITIKIEQADNPSNLPSSVINVSQRIENLKDVPLPENWQWQDANTALEVGVEVTATAEYTGADKGNYKNLTAVVKITRSDCNHDNTELRDVVTATCQQKGYTGDTYCTDCNELLLYGNETPLADHISDNGTVTKQPTTSETGERTFKCTVCGSVLRTETIAKLPSGGGSGGSTRPSEPTAPATPSRPDNEVPFIKDENGKNGWEVINEEIDKAENGSTVTVDMNGATVVPGNVFDTLKGRDVTVVFDMGDGITWSVNGKNVTSDKAPYIDFSVKTDTENIPVDVINNITGERYSIQISLAHNGEFGFTAVLSINLGSDNAGQKADLYYYTGDALKLMCESEISADGTTQLTFTHASDYLIVIGESETDEGDNSGTTSSGDSNTPSSGESFVSGDGDTGDNGANPSTGITVSLIPLVAAAAFITAAAKRKKK